MKRLLFLLLPCVLLLCAAAGVTAYAAPGEDASPDASVQDIPRITQIISVQGGVKIRFTPYEGAVSYRVFIKKTEGSGWKGIADTSALSCTRTGVTPYSTDIYTVRALDRSGRYCSGFDPAGYRYTYLPAPVLKSAESVNGGVKITWDAVTGAAGYRVYVRSGADWKVICHTASTSCIDANVASGSSYTYTIRAYDVEAGRALSYYDRSGVTVRYVAAPAISSIKPSANGLNIAWNAVSGAAKYRLFYRSGTSWKAIGTIAGTSMEVTNLTDQKEYLYTVRATDANGKYISGFNADGWAYRYIAPPKIIAVTPMSGDAHMYWDRVPNAAGYMVYRKSFGGSWTALGSTKLPSFTDRRIRGSTLCTYTVRTLDADGRATSYFVTDNRYYYNGVPADGKITYGGASLNFRDGYIRQGYVTVDGKTCYYDSSGVLMKNGVVGSAAEGYRYADANGYIDPTARLAVTSGGCDWNVLDGRAYKVTTEKDRTMFRALTLVGRLTKPTDTKAQKLRKCFDYLQTETYEYNPRVPHYRGMDWPIIYANDLFTTNGGNCLSYAAAFAFMAKAIGYDDVYACHSGGHGWTEIGGLIYDSEWQRSHHNYSYYGLSYYASTDVPYRDVQATFASNAWMHIEI